MDKSLLLAEKILITAARNPEGHYYPSENNASYKELDEAFKHLEIYGTCRIVKDGAEPIFTINSMGRIFASQGAWSEKERQERIAEERHQKQLKISTWTLCTSIASIIIMILIAIISCSCNRLKTEKDIKKRSTSTQPDREIKQYVLTTEDDSVFHYSTVCSQLSGSPELSNEYIERKDGKWMCPECGIKEAEFLIHKEEYMNDLREADSIY